MNEQVPFDFEAARRRRDEGAANAAAHADRVNPNWSGDAAHFLYGFLKRTSVPFLTEQVVAEAKAANFPAPPDGRAWGAVIQRAHRARQIEKAGYAAAATSNCSPKVQWRSLICHG